MDFWLKIKELISGITGPSKGPAKQEFKSTNPRTDHRPGEMGDRPSRPFRRYPPRNRYRNGQGFGPRPQGQQGQQGPRDQGRYGKGPGQGPRRWQGRRDGRNYSRGPGNYRGPERQPKEERKFLVGVITHFFPKVNAAVVKVQKGAIQVNDLLVIEGKATHFRQKVTSLQMDHQPVNLARVGEEVGIQVQQKVREGDQVYRVDYVSPSR